MRMQDKKKAAALRWFSDYHFYRQMEKREQDPEKKKYFQDRAREAKNEYDSLMREIGGR